jgi:nucleotide-binding universal stress UspA family protein
MKKIIVPIDFSQHSEYALKTAAILAKKHGSEIVVLHMLELPSAFISSTTDSHETLFYIKIAEKKFDKFLDKEYLKDIHITPIIKHFKVFSEINDVATKHKADLIIMGSHGVNGIKEAFIGSNTEKVIRHASIPILVIKEGPILTNFDNVVFACDFTDKAVKPYNDAKELFKMLNSTMHLVYVNTPNYGFKSSSEMEIKVADFLNKAEGNLDKLEEVNYVSDYSIEEGILSFSNRFGADLIGVATNGRKGVLHFFEGSVSEDVANHSTLPVISFKI